MEQRRESKTDLRLYGNSLDNTKLFQISRVTMGSSQPALFSITATNGLYEINYSSKFLGTLATFEYSGAAGAGCYYIGLHRYTCFHHCKNKDPLPMSLP